MKAFKKKSDGSEYGRCNDCEEWSDLDNWSNREVTIASEGERISVSGREHGSYTYYEDTGVETIWSCPECGENTDNDDFRTKEMDIWVCGVCQEEYPDDQESAGECCA